MSSDGIFLFLYAPRPTLSARLTYPQSASVPRFNAPRLKLLAKQSNGENSIVPPTLNTTQEFIYISIELTLFVLVLLSFDRKSRI